MMNDLLILQNIFTSYEQDARDRKYILEDLSLTVQKNEFLGLIGESGSGKTTLANLIAGFMYPDRGEIIFHSDHLENLTARRRRQKLQCGIQMIFQDPYGSFNPVHTIAYQLNEVLKIQKKLEPSEIEARVEGMIEAVGLSKDFLNRYPNQLSGGQLQRIAIGAALLLEPCLLLADEPVSALDVSVQAQILDLFQELREKFQFSCLFISHDLAVVYHLCDRIAILKEGCIVEIGETEKIFENPQHPYTKLLIDNM